MRIARNQHKTKLIAITIASLLVLFGGYIGFAYTTKSVWPFEAAPHESTNEAGEINYSPPTDQEVEDSQNAKKNNSPQDNGVSSTDNSEGKRTVSVGIAFAGYDPDEKAIDIRAFTPDIIEGDGTCTATLTQGSSTVRQSSKAFVDYSSSQCKPIMIPENRFTPKGTWSLTVTYESGDATGASPTMDIEVGQ